MKPRAFVVMPFQQRKLDLLPAMADEPGRGHSEAQSVTVDFDSIWEDLIKPALEMAGCEPFRADSEISAGDIRTDMFFELVTADYVVADLSITNANVYYELGIRDGICPRGAFIINGGWPVARPFDVAQDRSFQYKGHLFEVHQHLSAVAHGHHSGTHEAAAAAPAKTVHRGGDHHAVAAREALREPPLAENELKAEKTAEARKLATVFQRAFLPEVAETGSPLYSHLPGLVPANWENIDTSRARVFGALQSDWQEKVRRAQEMNRPGHILTIAQYAPTRIHRTKILLEAAIALIGLERFTVAEEVLEKVLQASPDNVNAQLYLAIARIQNEDVEGAEHQLRTMLRKREDDPVTNMILGYVYRLLWHLTWRKDPNPRARAKASPRMLMESIESFCKVHRFHADQYLSGYNGLLLIGVAQDLFQEELKLPPVVFDPQAMTTVVRYVAESAQQEAQEKGDHEGQFWSSVALSGLELLAGNKSTCLQYMRDACETPSTTLFDLRLMEERANFLSALEFKRDIVDPVLEIVQQALKEKLPANGHKRVFVFHGHAIDKPNSGRVFPRTIKDKVEAEIRRTIAEWNIGQDDLAICSACTECDVFFGEQCLEREARVRVLLQRPSKAEMADEMRDPEFGEWTNRRSLFLGRVGRLNELWFDQDELGLPVDTTSLAERHWRWILNTARIEAEKANADSGPSLYGLALSDGRLTLDNPADSTYFVTEIRRSVRFQGVARVIDLHGIAEGD